MTYVYARSTAPDNPDRDLERHRYAMQIWEEAGSSTIAVADTIVQTYLRSRAITIPIPDCIRFHGGVWHREWGGYRPAMVALLTDGGLGVPWAVHVTWLQEDGTDKATLCPPVRKTFGPLKGKGLSIRLAPAAEELAIGEGIETCLSYVQLTGTPTWAAASIFGLKGIKLPAIVRRVVLLADNKPNDPGPAACRITHRRLAMYGVRARIAIAPKGKDFNDVLKGK